MSTSVKPVWVWLPGAHQPVQCGTFSLVNAVGTFEYTSAYKGMPGAISIDPAHLPLTRSMRPYKETRQGGLFGVLRDASPEGFGLAMLEHLKQQTLTDPLARLELSEGDAVGALEVCDDIQAKRAYQPPLASELFKALRDLPDTRPSSQAAREVKGLHGTSLGGERPKLTVMHQGQYWIAKLQDRGDAPHMPLREFVAMRIAQELGLDVAPVQFHQLGARQVLLVQRFDRHVDAGGQVERRLYASAHTVLRLDHQTRGEKSRSYVALARELQRFCADRTTSAEPMQQELWRRMAYNVICGNGDDHPRNHGFIHQAGHWRLAPAFDIAPYLTYSGTQAMAITRSGGSIATQANLLQDCQGFACSQDEARAFITHARAVLLDRWPQLVRSCGYEPEQLPVRDPAEWLAPGVG